MRQAELLASSSSLFTLHLPQLVCALASGGLGGCGSGLSGNGSGAPPAALPYDFEEKDYNVPEHELHVVRSPSTLLGPGRSSQATVLHLSTALDLYVILNNFATANECREFERMKSSIKYQSVSSVPVLPVEGPHAERCFLFTRAICNLYI